MKDFEEIKKFANISTTVNKIIRYEFNLTNDEYFCKNCKTIYKSDNIPDFCSKCGGHWNVSFVLPIENPVIVEESELVNERELVKDFAKEIRQLIETTVANLGGSAHLSLSNHGLILLEKIQDKLSEVIV